jgi:hypothetical protein
MHNRLALGVQHSGKQMIVFAVRAGCRDVRITLQHNIDAHAPGIANEPSNLDAAPKHTVRSVAVYHSVRVSVRTARIRTVAWRIVGS